MQAWNFWRFTFEIVPKNFMLLKKYLLECHVDQCITSQEHSTSLINVFVTIMYWKVIRMRVKLQVCLFLNTYVRSHESNLFFFANSKKLCLLPLQYHYRFKSFANMCRKLYFNGINQIVG